MNGRYIREISDILKLGCLPMKEKRDFHLLKLVYEAKKEKDLS